MTPPPTPSDSRLRWWQDAAPVSSSPTHGMQAQAQLAAPPQTELETEDALELEAVRRVALLKDAVVMEGTPRRQQRVMMAMGMFLLAYAVFLVIGVCLIGYTWRAAPVALFLLLESAVMMTISRRIARQSPPRLTISALGISMETAAYSMGQVFWDEIQSVRIRQSLLYRYVEIRLKNAKATRKRTFVSKIKGPAWFVSNDVSSLPIMIIEPHFGVKAEAVAAQIARFRPSASE